MRALTFNGLRQTNDEKKSKMPSNHEISANPLPSHRMGAEREQEMDTYCSTEVCRPTAGLFRKYLIFNPFRVVQLERSNAG
jgi:hypothetical protein